MTDRELLELAAKAAGYSTSHYWHENEKYEFTDGPHGWNPITDDGDAMRLAAKLYLWGAVRMAHRDVSADVNFFTATRRAIVLAAAEIGRAKE